jgi:hypothetical protein
MKKMKEHEAKREKKSLLEPLANHKGNEEGKIKKIILLETLFTTTKGEKRKERKICLNLS